ncbi:tryptophan synthase beta subunit-like PLP-dependent enzyme [Wolfiporia cocos MD-104 SS10]|uniref:L-serine ammonia-lyase n=1 Tax=Wolfiporia cocos (strain MD-104) TaxID=742152 RepID=A0A2H3J9R8_WOLCO|nr:tryptophan synthase beta subunit-like PLP-dependent enzyme [Wolfiporia cocos MD-104 SS10]
MSVADKDPEKLWLETPLVYSPHISARLGCNVYLKLENLHPSHSFKYRGISYFIQHAVREHGCGVHLIAASGGNAGLAVACAAKALGVRCTVFLPEGVSASTVDFMRAEGAEIIVGGKCYLQALNAAEDAVKASPLAFMVPAYDHPLLWEGHGSMIPEIARQLPAGTKPDAIFCSVGGGGLFGGVMEGCKAAGWDDVPLVTLETHGCSCFYQSLALNPGPFPESSTPPEGVRVERDETHGVAVAHLSALPSRATSLGASSPAAGVVAQALKWKGGIKSVCIPDELAMEAAMKFADDHKIMVELACSTTLTPAYRPSLFNKLVPPLGAERTVVFVVCGGFKISLKELEEYRQIVEADAARGGEWDVLCNGERWSVNK